MRHRLEVPKAQFVNARTPHESFPAEHLPLPTSTPKSQCLVDLQTGTQTSKAERARVKLREAA